MNTIDTLINDFYPLFENNHETPPEVALWRAVIMQQLVDASSNSKRKYLRIRKDQAMAWLAGTSQDFVEVCLLADLDPHYVRKRCRYALMNKNTWRKYNPNSFTGKKRKKPSDPCSE